MRKLLGLTLLLWLCEASQPGEPDKDAVQTEKKKLEGAWVEAHALAKEKPKGKGGYYAWIFKGDKVARQHTQTLDGEPLIGSGHAGTYGLDISAQPKAIDIILKSPAGEDWKYLGIYAFDGDGLKLCVAKEERPKAFENKGNNRLYILKRPPKK